MKTFKITGVNPGEEWVYTSPFLREGGGLYKIFPTFQGNIMSKSISIENVDNSNIKIYSINIVFKEIDF